MTVAGQKRRMNQNHMPKTQRLMQGVQKEQTEPGFCEPQPETPLLVCKPVNALEMLA